jgi:hypothetical protein
MSRAERHMEETENRSTGDRVGQRIEQAEPVVETVPTANTTEEEEREFRASHSADRPPTEDEEEAAEAHGPLDPAVATAVEEAARRGANVKGEGEVP